MCVCCVVCGVVCVCVCVVSCVRCRVALCDVVWRCVLCVVWCGVVFSFLALWCVALSCCVLSVASNSLSLCPPASLSHFCSSLAFSAFGSLPICLSVPLSMFRICLCVCVYVYPLFVPVLADQSLTIRPFLVVARLVARVVARVGQGRDLGKVRQSRFAQRSLLRTLGGCILTQKMLKNGGLPVKATPILGYPQQVPSKKQTDPASQRHASGLKGMRRRVNPWGCKNHPMASGQAKEPWCRSGRYGTHSLHAEI